MSDLYAEAMAYFMRNLTTIKPPESDPVAWNLSTGLHLLAQAIQQDMAAVKEKLDALSSGATK